MLTTIAPMPDATGTAPGAARKPARPLPAAGPGAIVRPVTHGPGRSRDWSRREATRTRYGEDQGEDPGRRDGRRRDDPDHLGVHQGEADPSLSRYRPEVLRPRHRVPRPDRRPGDDRRRQRH